MNRKNITTAAAALLAGLAFTAGAVAPASAANDPAKPKAKQEEPKRVGKNPNQKICVESAATGSRIAKQECLTRGEWISLIGKDPSDPASR